MTSRRESKSEAIEIPLTDNTGGPTIIGNGAQSNDQSAPKPFEAISSTEERAAEQDQSGPEGDNQFLKSKEATGADDPNIPTGYKSAGRPAEKVTRETSPPESQSINPSRLRLAQGQTEVQSGTGAPTILSWRVSDATESYPSHLRDVDLSGNAQDELPVVKQEAR
jgi:hypothetical protein